LQRKLTKEEFWERVFKTMDELANGDNLAGWDLPGLKKLLEKIKKADTKNKIKK